MTTYNGLGRNLGNLSWLSEAHTRSISAENPTGAKGMGGMADPEPDGPARELGRGWKARPYVTVGPQETVVLADGFSCQTQIEDLSDRRGVHLVELLSGT